MIITCPTCSTRYTLADQAVGPHGRKVRCAKCGHIWWQTPAEDEEESPFSFSDEVTEIRSPQTTMAHTTMTSPLAAGLDDSPAAKRRRRGALAGWAVFALVLGGIAAGGYLGRAEIVRLWPPSALLYETVGLPVDPPGAGLKLQNVRSEQKLDGGSPVLLVEGQIVNVSDVARPVPPVRAVTLGPDQQPVQSWTIDASPAQLLPGEIAVFRHAQRDPGTVAEVMITFGGG